MNSLKYTIKEINSIIKQFTTSKTNFIKSQKINVKDSNNIYSLSTDKIIVHVEKINKLIEDQSSTLKITKLSSPTLMFKKTQPQSNISVGKLSLIQNEIFGIMKINSSTKQTQQNINHMTFAILYFHLQQLLFLTKVKFHLLTFLSNNQQIFNQEQKNQQKNVVIETIDIFEKQKNFFLLIYKSVVEKQQQLFKSFQQLQNLRQDYKSYLLRLSAVFYQLIYNFTDCQPEKYASFFIFISSLITDKTITNFLNHNISKIEDKNDKQKKKGFLSFFKKQVKEKGLTNKSQTIQKSKSLNKKQKIMQSVSISMNEVNAISVQQKSQQRKQNRDMSKKQSNKTSKSMKSSQLPQITTRQQFFLTKDEIQIVQFYQFSLLQKIFTHETDTFSLVQVYRKMIEILLKSYVSHTGQQVQEENEKSFHDRIQELMLKIIYKDEKLRHQDLLGQEELKYTMRIGYEQLLNRSITILTCVHQFLIEHKHKQINNQNDNQKQTNLPLVIIQHSNFLLDFVVTLYEKIMMAHKSFIQGQISQTADFSGKYNLSQNINSHRNLNKETQHKFNLLYVMNTIAINIISLLYRSPQSLVSEQEKVCELNSLLTLHQIFVNQFNFPNYETENQILQSFRQRPKKSFREEKENVDIGLQLLVDTHQQYIISLQSLKKQLIKTHERTYEQLKRLYDSNIPSYIFVKQTTNITNSKQKGTQSPMPTKQKTPFQQYEQYILSYQNIILESLQQTANDLEQTFIGYYKKNKVYLTQTIIKTNNSMDQKMFTYFQKISSHIFNYLSCLMMIFYRNNHAVQPKDSTFVVKNNVMTSLKLIKVLEKVVIFFWELFWNFNDQSIVLSQSKEKQAKKQNPMLIFIQQLNVNFFKLLQKFCFPRSSEKFDYRHIKSCLIISPILDIYMNKLTKHTNTQSQFIEKRIKDSKQLIKSLLQTIQRASLSTSIQQFQATNIQSKTKLSQTVIQKTLTIFSTLLKETNKQLGTTMMPQLIYNQHFNILVQLMFQNYSQLKQKIDQQNFLFVGEENFVLNVIKNRLKNVNLQMWSGKGNGIKQNEFMLTIDENQLQKLTVILQMYLSKQQYIIENEKITLNICLKEQLNQIPLLSMQIFQQIVNFVLKIQLINSKSYSKVIKIINQSKYFDLGFLIRLKENIGQFKRFVVGQEERGKYIQQKEQQRTKANVDKNILNIQEYIKLFLQFYQKLMTSYIISFTSQRDHSISPTYMLEIGYQIFLTLFQLNKQFKFLFIQQLLSLWRMKKSLNLKIKISHSFKKIKLQLLVFKNICLKGGSVINENFQVVNQILQNIYEQMSLLAEKFLKSPKKSYKYIKQLIQPFKQSKFFLHLFEILNQLPTNKSNNTLLIPSQFLQLINTTFISFSQQTFKQINKPRTFSNLATLQTPTFKLEQQQKKNKRQSSIIKHKVSLKTLQIEQNDQQLQCELSRNMSRGLYKNNNNSWKQNFVCGGGQQQMIEQNNNNKQLIVSQLQFVGGDNEQELSQQNNGIIKTDDNIISQASLSNQGSEVIQNNNQQLSSTTTIIKEINKQKLTIIQQFTLFYHNLITQIFTIINATIVNNNKCDKKQQSYIVDEDFMQILLNVSEMFNKLSMLSIYNNQESQYQHEQALIQSSQQITNLVKSHIQIGYWFRELIKNYLQIESKIQTQTQNKRLLLLRHKFQSIIKKICINCPQSVIDDIQLQDDVRKYVKQVHQQCYNQLVMNKQRKPTKQLTLNPKNAKIHFQLNTNINDNIQFTSQQQINQNKTKSQFDEYFTLIDQLKQLINNFQQKQQQTLIKNLLQSKTKKLTNFLLQQYIKIISTPYHQQTNNTKIIIKIFQQIKSILIIDIWKQKINQNHLSSRSSQQISQQIKTNIYQIIYQMLYPCMVQYIDVCTEVAMIVKDILKHNIMVVNNKKQHGSK